MSEVNDAIISVESTCEWQIHDILYDGQERYLQPLVFSDQVAKLAHKVDWKKICQRTHDELHSQTVSTVAVPPEEQEKTKSSSSSQPVAGPWEKVAKYLGQSLIELNVLSDVLLIGHSKKYLTLEQIHLDKEEFNKSLAFVGKKKAMFVASKTLTGLAERISVEKKSKVAQGAAHYQNELLELRKLWKLKKVGSTILGDLSYKSFGSKFRPSATFEVRKRNLEEINASGEKRSVEIILPKELKESCCLAIQVEKNGIPIISTRLPYLNLTHSAHKHGGWQKQLEMAQLSILSRDLFAQLAKEAFHLSSLSCNVKDESISIMLHPETALHIRLEPLSKLNDNPLRAKCFLEDAVYKLFCVELDSVEGEIPRPTSGPLGLRKKLRLAGSLATCAEDIQGYRNNDQLLLEKLIYFVKHHCLLQQLRTVLDELKHNSFDPAISYHWCSLSSLMETSVRISIFSPGMEAGLGSKISFTVDVGVADMRVTFREGDVPVLSCPGDLVYLIRRQMAEHQIHSFWQLAKGHSYNCLSLNIFTLSDEAQPCPSAYVSSQDGLRSLVVRCPINSTPIILVQLRTKSQEGFQSDMIPAEPWGLLRGNYSPVDYNRLLGRSFLQKMEFFLQMSSV